MRFWLQVIFSTVLLCGSTLASTTLSCAQEPIAGLGLVLPVELVSDEAKEHLDWARCHGYERVWLQYNEIPTEDIKALRAWKQTTRDLQRNGWKVGLLYQPAKPGVLFDWTDTKARKQSHKALKHILKNSGVSEFVFDSHLRSIQLKELNSAARFGRFSIEAEADWVRYFKKCLGRKISMFWWPSISTNRAMELANAPPFPKLSRNVGIIWSGPDRVFSLVTTADLNEFREWVGSRDLILRDGYPMNQDQRGLATALVLGALRGRSPHLFNASSGLSAYVSHPMTQLGASRLAQWSVTQWLLREDYSAEQIEKEYIQSGSIENPDVAAAIRTQILEWGGPVNGRNYRPAWDENPEAIARKLNDPAFVASFKWVRERYPDRIKAIQKFADKPFAEDVVVAMKRRLVIAKAIPSVMALRSDTPYREAHLSTLRALTMQRDPTVKAAIHAFLKACDVPGLQLAAE